MLRPFKVGDYVSAGGVTGSVREIGLFNTVILTDDNVESIVENNKIFSDTIQNFSVNPYRRVQRTAQLGPGANTSGARAPHRRTRKHSKCLDESRASRRHCGFQWRRTGVGADDVL